MWDWRRHEQLWDKGKFVLKLQTENIYISYRKLYMQYIQYTTTISLDWLCVKPSIEDYIQTHEGLLVLALPLSNRMNQNSGCPSHATLQCFPLVSHLGSLHCCL